MASKQREIWYILYRFHGLEMTCRHFVLWNLARSIPLKSSLSTTGLLIRNKTLKGGKKSKSMNFVNENSWSRIEEISATTKKTYFEFHFQPLLSWDGLFEQVRKQFFSNKTWKRQKCFEPILLWVLDSEVPVRKEYLFKWKMERNYRNRRERGQSDLVLPRIEWMACAHIGICFVW